MDTLTPSLDNEIISVLTTVNFKTKLAVAVLQTSGLFGSDKNVVNKIMESINLRLRRIESTINRTENLLEELNGKVEFYSFWNSLGHPIENCIDHYFDMLQVPAQRSHLINDTAYAGAVAKEVNNNLFKLHRAIAGEVSGRESILEVYYNFVAAKRYRSMETVVDMVSDYQTFLLSEMIKGLVVLAATRIDEYIERWSEDMPMFIEQYEDKFNEVRKSHFKAEDAWVDFAALENESEGDKKIQRVCVENLRNTTSEFDIPKGNVIVGISFYIDWSNTLWLLRHFGEPNSEGFVMNRKLRYQGDLNNLDKNQYADLNAHYNLYGKRRMDIRWDTTPIVAREGYVITNIVLANHGTFGVSLITPVVTFTKFENGKLNYSDQYEHYKHLFPFSSKSCPSSNPEEFLECKDPGPFIPYSHATHVTPEWNRPITGVELKVSRGGGNVIRQRSNYSLFS